MRSKQTILWTALLLGAAAALAASGAAAAAGELATMNAFGGGVSWTPRAHYQGLSLSVSGGDFAAQRHFGAGETPAFELVDAAGKALPDGTYNWELVVIPRARTADRYGSGRGEGDAAAASQARRPARQVQSGAFTILNGQVVDPNLEEPVRRRGGRGAARADR